MERIWYVLQVKPRTEKKTMLFLREYGYWRYLPLYTKVTKVQRHKIRRQLPVFPGYVFSKLAPDERVRMLQTNLITRTIAVTRPRLLIHQLRQVSRAAKNTTQLKILAKTFKKGDYARIVSGPMRNMEGYVKREPGGTSICLNVEILGTSVEVKITPDMLEKTERK